MFDAVVVGAGPAGATTARLLAKKGFKVLLLEKKRLPRKKLCAGAVSVRAERYLPKDWENAVLNTVRGGNLGWRGERYVNARADKPVVKIVDRAGFDLFLTLKAVDEGATLKEGETFLNFRTLGDGSFEVFTDGGTYRTKYLVGADGAMSKVLRAWGCKRKPVAVLEAEVKTRIGDMDEVFIDLGVVKWGYAWIFPRGEDTVSVGLASLKGEEKDLRTLLVEYIENHPLLRGGGIKRIGGWFIPISKGKLIRGEGNLFFVGDASGATDAVLGEGIYYSLWQAHVLAECLPSENPHGCYKKRLKPLEREFLFSYLTGFLAYNFQRLLFKHATPKDLARFFELLRGEIGYPTLWVYGFKRFLRSLVGV